jgi:NAD(P)-dependent dehydrogenase (short-subunit alcohol dehydrogenase family)
MTAALTDRVAIVFGSATGIGAACARTPADRGAAVVVADMAVAAAPGPAGRAGETLPRPLALPGTVPGQIQVSRQG